MRNSNAGTYYLFIETTSALFFSLAFTAMSLYEIQVAGLSPLQLVLIGTTLELSVLLCEVPTGVVADVYSRRLSIIIGLGLIGLGFLLEGLLPFFATILLAQVLWGLGYTFTSGATQAWLSDEIGEEPANRAFLRVNKFGLGGSLAGMLLAILIGGRQIALPILVSGGSFILLAGVLSVSMPETGFHPASMEERNSFQQMVRTFRLGLRSVRQRPRLVSILSVGLFYGLYSEGFDRLWVKHLLGRFSLPVIFGSNEIGFFGLLNSASVFLSIAVTAQVEKRFDASRPRPLGRLMSGITIGIAAFIIIFAWSPWLGLTLVAYLLIAALRNLVGPLTNAWVNQKLDSEVRATVLSMIGQVDAFGQIAGGPFIGLVANLLSVPAAMTVSGLLLTPALPLIGSADSKEPLVEEDKTNFPPA
jgi:MFS transporter, DHA3 family, tetracycline resistance protein